MSRGGSGGHTRVLTARKRTPQSTRWLERQLNDPYVKRAKADGFRSRAAYKLSELDERFAEAAGRWPVGSDVPLPDFWGGFRVVPDVLEFWAGRDDRLHDRLRYRRTDERPGGAAWLLERLAP